MTLNIKLLLFGDSECNKMDVAYCFNSLATPRDEREDLGIFNVSFGITRAQ